MFAQQIPLGFERYGTESGLPSGTVRYITQDSIGFIWFGTLGGLVRFDGHRMMNYASQSGDSASIPNNSVWSILPIEMNKLLVGTFGGGLSIFHRPTDTFHPYPNFFEEGYSLFQRRVTSIVRTRNGTLCIGTNGGGVKILRAGMKRFIRYKHIAENPKSLSSNFVTSIHEDKVGYLWVGTNGEGLNRLDLLSGKCITYKHEGGNINSIPDNIVTTLYEDRSGHFWIGTNAGLCLFDIVKNTFTTFRYQTHNITSVDCNRIQTLFEDRIGRFWIGTYGGGLLQFDRMSATFAQYMYNALDPHSLSDNRVYSIFEDRTGVLWIGTQNGVNKCILDGTGFQHYSLVGKSLNSNLQNDVKSIYQDIDGSLYVGTDGDGLHVLKEKGNCFTEERVLKSWQKYLEKTSVYSLMRDGAKSIWVGLFGSGLRVIDNHGKMIRSFDSHSSDSVQLNQNDVLCQYKDSKGNIWIGTNGGLHKYNYHQKKIILYVHERNNTHSISDNRIRSILESDDSCIWVGTENGGMDRLEVSSGIWYRERLRADGKESSLFDGMFVSCLRDAGNSKLWIGTIGNGLLLFDRKTNFTEQFTIKDGLVSNTICGLLTDNHGTAWISTNKGLSRFDLANRHCRNYDKSDGLQINEFNIGACYQGADGRMYFGGTNGFIVFHPDSIKVNSFIPPIVITDIKLQNRSLSCRTDSAILSVAASDAKEISIEYGKIPLTFEFASLHYSNPSRNQYAYMLDGYNTKWIYTGTSNFITFTNLHPGTYIFHIRGTNNDGVWNEIGKAITIHIIPPLYMTVWFKWTGRSLFIILIGLLFYVRQKRMRKKEKMEKGIVESELKALRLQMNPHFIFNSLNAIQSFVINSDVEKANAYLSKFARLMRMILENSKQQTILLKNEIEFLHLYLEIELVRFEDRFDYTLQVDPALSGDVRLPSMLLQPYVENAIRHGLLHKTSRGKLTIKLVSLDDTIVASIEDDGIGRRSAMEIKARQGSSYQAFGMDITRDRLKILNTYRKKEMRLNIIDLHNERGEPNGTRIEISIPIE